VLVVLVEVDVVEVANVVGGAVVVEELTPQSVL